MRRNRGTHSPVSKLRWHWRYVGELNVTELDKKYDVDVVQVADWKGQLMDAAADVSDKDA